MTVVVRAIEGADGAAWLAMRHALWPEGSVSEHQKDIDEFLSGRSGEPHAVLIAEDSVRGPVGFVELSIRPWAEGCRTRGVAYLEGWFVLPEARRRGVGRLLIRAAEEWGRAKGCEEFASDSLPDAAVSIAAHEAVGFEDAGLIRCFRKDL